MRNAARGAVSLCLLGLLGCGGTASVAAPTIRVSVQDFKITAPKHVPAGEVIFLVHNKGPDAHEFIVVRTDQPLPLRKDGVTADEDAFEKQTAGVLEPGAPGSYRKLRVHLKPGRYELVCNIGGMRAQVTAG
jgi:uncharacterized cupredoxin-like copper-binding protein